MTTEEMQKMADLLQNCKPLKEEISFFVPGDPVGKGRPRFFHGHAVTPEKTRKTETVFRWYAEQALNDVDWIKDRAMRVSVDCFYPVPKSWSKKKKAAALDGIYMPEVKPDIDNVVKLVLDSCNGVLWDDDKRVIVLTASKRYGRETGIRMTVRFDE